MPSEEHGQAIMQPAHVDAALGTAHARLAYQYGPVWQSDYWDLMWEGLTGRWESIRDRDEQADDESSQAKLVADGGTEGRAIQRTLGTAPDHEIRSPTCEYEVPCQNDATHAIENFGYGGEDRLACDTCVDEYREWGYGTVRELELSDLLEVR